MNRIYLLFALAVLLPLQVFGQPDTLHKVCTYEEFPVGAMRYALADTLEKMLGMNFNWMGFDPSNVASFPMHSKVHDPAHVTAITDPFYWDTNAVSKPTYSSNLWGLLQDASYGQDIRIYLPNTSGITQEYLYTWKKKRLGTNPTSPVVRPQEWQIDTNGTTVGEYVLDSLDDGAQNDLYRTDGYVEKNLLKDHLGTFSYDFIFYFEQSDLNAVGDSIPLYSVEYWIKKPGSNVYNLMAADTITKARYNALAPAETQAHPNEDVNAEHLYEWYNNQPSARFYKLLNRTLALRDSFTYNGSIAIANPQIDIRLRCFKNIRRIFVRGLRIRDWRAQRLLGGYADVALNSAVSQLKTLATNNAFKSWTIANENHYQAFHCWAYVNNFLIHQNCPPADILSPPWMNNQLFMRVLRDQTNWDASKKGNGILWDEQTIFGGIAWKSSGFTGSYPNKTFFPFWDWDYPGHGGFFTPSPIPGGMTNDSAGWWQRAIFVYNDKASFTNMWQNKILGYSSEAYGGGIGQSQAYLERGRSCYELDPNHKVPYYLMAQTLVEPTRMPKWKVDTLYKIKQDSLRHTLGNDYLADSLAAYWADSLYDATIIAPYLASNGTNNLVEDSLFDLFFNCRNPTPAELLYQMWAGVSTGMKGYAINIAYSDGVEQMGFLRDSEYTIAGVTHKLILKSNEQTNHQLKFYKLDSPWGHFHYGSPLQYTRAVPLLPGFSNLYKEIRSMIDTDMRPIVKTLGLLDWKGTLSWHKRDSCPTYLLRTPIKNLETRAMNGTKDDDTNTFMQVTTFTKPGDTTARFVSFLNRRLWCNTTNTDSTDYRWVSFKVDTTKFNSATQNVRLWKITDISGKSKEKIMAATDSFSFKLKPGDGRIFRIAPDIGITAGTMDQNIFNNSRHFCAIEDSTNIIKYAATYEYNDSIFVSYPVETPTGGSSKRILGTPPQSMIFHDAGNGIVRYPAIAHSHSKRMGLVYQITRPINSTTDSIEVWLRIANDSDKYNFNSGSKLVAKFRAATGFIAAPAIAAHRDSSRLFWVGWTTNGNGVDVEQVGQILGQVHNLSIVTGPIHISAHNAAYAEFISLASHRESTDSVFVAFEEKNQIYFTTVGKDFSGLHKSTPIQVSTGGCHSRYPQIAIKKDNTVGIVWQVAGSDFTYVKPPKGFSFISTRSKCLVDYRQRNNAGGWQKTVGFQAMVAPKGSHILFDTVPAYPNVEMALYHNNIGTWGDPIRISWNNSIDELAGIARGDNKTPMGWKAYHLIEPSLEPAMPITLVGDSTLQPMMFRMPSTNEDGKNVRITQYDFPIANISDTIPGIVRIKAYLPDNCAVVSTTLSGMIVIKKDSIATDSMPPMPVDLGNGSQTPLSADADILAWNDNRLRSEDMNLETDDTLRYNRYFSVGEYNAGDTSDVSGYLTDSSDYIKFRIVLRQTGTNNLLMVLDSSILKKAGFVQTGDVTWDSSHKQVVFNSTLGTAYLSIEADRGDAGNPFELSLMTEYGVPTPIDSWPPPEPMEKRSEPKPSNNSIPSTPIEVTVVPNPFRTTARASIDVAKDVPLNIALFDLLGRKIADIIDGISEQTHYEFSFGYGLSEGTYLLRIQSGNSVETRKVELIK